MRAVKLISFVIATSSLTVLGTETPHPTFDSIPVQTASLDAANSASERLDAIVFSRLKELGIKPANLSSDAVFIRRAYLVTIGTLPRMDEVEDFLASQDETKRAMLVEHLLSRPEYATYWALRWGDTLRVKAEFPINLWPNAAQAYHRWIHASLQENKPFHIFCQELLVGNGSNFREGQVNFYRATQDRTPKGIAATVALTFMGERAEKWPEKKLEAMSGFFANIAFKETGEWKEEIVYFDPEADKEGLHKQAIFPDGTPVNLDPAKGDPRHIFATWLLRPENPWFAKCASNRIWAWMMGRGIVQDPDDFRPDNPPSNPELLSFLEEEFIKSRCDVKHLIRVILNSQTFGLSSIYPDDSEEAAINFARYPLRRIEAEVLVDALNQITETTEEYSSAIPEPYTFVPENIRSIALPDGSLTSSFLELFGRPPRDTGYFSERSTETNAAQRLHLLNSSHVQRKIEASPLVAGVSESKTDLDSLIEKIYLTTVARPPTDEELQELKNYAETSSASMKVIASDLLWALINQPEFFYNH